MLDYVHTIVKTGEQFNHPLPENWKELVEQEGKEKAFGYAIHGYRIACNAVDRGAGKESKRALSNEAIAKIKQLDPELLKEAGLTDLLAKL